MRRFRAWALRMRGFFAGPSAEIDAELASHLQLHSSAPRRSASGWRSARAAVTSSYWVMARGVSLALIGTGIGVFAALALTETIARTSSSSLTYGVHAYGPWTMAAVTLLLLFVAALACALPAGKAMRTDPMQALRTE